jgi:hypothetical protein
LLPYLLRLTPRGRPPLSGVVDHSSHSINRKFLTRGLQSKEFLSGGQKQKMPALGAGT